MKVLLGETRGYENLAILQRHGWGRMFQLRKPTPYRFEPWGFDNQAFMIWKAAGFPMGLDIDGWLILWDSQLFERRIEEAKSACCDPYLAVVPDIPGSPNSLEFSLFWRNELPRNWPWYLAVQDGMTVEAVEEVLHMFSGIFLGGSDRFKGTALQWCKLAHKHGLPFHYGRAGTLEKSKHAFMVHADSCDSSFPLWTKARMKRFIAHVGGLHQQMTTHEAQA